ncbi:MAG: OmcA/MtrC family decaheme c-type cytochrome, partial [Gammaproteobacteria bacterium]
PKTPDADNFTKPNREACGSCHDDSSFAAVTPDPNDPNRTVAHVGGPQADDSMCLTCHGPGVLPPLPGTVTKSHIIPERTASACFQYNILDISPQPAQGQTITVRFSVTNPSPGANPNPEADPCPATTTYDILNDPHFQPAGGARRLVVDVGWDTNDFNNTGSGGAPPSRTIEADALTTAVDVGAVPGTEFEVTAAVPVTANGTGSVAVEGHPACDPVTTSCRAIVQGVVENFLIDPTLGAAITARREVVNVITKCDRCHDVLSLHGSNRSEVGDLCVMCHNPNGTDINRRTGLPGGIGIDGKTEESIDFKRLIHALHAAAETNFDGTITHGFRRTGIVVYGFGGNPHDYSDLRFSGALWKCETCHLGSTFKLEGIWEQPAQNGILGSTIDTGAIVGDPSDDLKISPTAAVCSSCHDSTVAQAHMEVNGALFAANQATIATNVESCAVCHGPGTIASVELVHEGGFGEEIP